MNITLDGQKLYTESVVLNLIDVIVYWRRQALPNGHCPYAYSDKYKPLDENNCDNCNACETHYFMQVKEDYINQICKGDSDGNI